MPSIDLDAIRRRAGSLFSGFTTGQKVMTGLAALGLLVGGLTFMQWAGRPNYAPLYSNLEGSDAASITERLSSEGVPYELANNGTTIMVPDDQVHQTRLNLSAQGLPSGGASGYALLDKQGITTSEFRQRVDFQRALEGELSKTISAIDGVEASTVHLVIPRDDLFADDETRPTASVLIKTRPGSRFAARTTQAIVHLVSSSVEGLNPGDVTVADSSGSILASPGIDGVDVAAGDIRSEQTMSFEQTLSDSVEQMLAQVVGAGGAVVRVKADLDFDQRETHSERVEPTEPPAATSERTVTESFTGTNSAVGGVLGPDATPTGNEGTSDYQREEEEREIAVSRVTEDIRSAPGQVRRLSVAVLIDQGKGADAQPAEVENLVAAAVGFDPDRGDTIEVTEMEFDRTAAEEAEEALAEAEAERRRREMFGLIRTGGALLIVFIVLFLAWRSVRRSRGERVSIPLESLALPAGSPRVGGDGADLDDLELELAEAAGERQLAAAPAQALPAVQSEVAQLIDRQPEEVANLLRGWLADRRR